MSLNVEQSPGQLLHEAWISLRTLGKRSILALLGIVIGSSSVVALINIGHNAAEDASAIFKDLGTDTLVVQFPASGSNPPPMPATLDMATLREAVPGLAHVAPTILSSTSVVFQGRTVSGNIVGTTAELEASMRIKLREGRFLSDFDQGQTFVVVGDRIANALSSAGHPLQTGDRIRVDNYLYQVIGIVQPQPQAILIPIAANDSLFMPIEGLRRIVASPQIGNVIARVAPEYDMNATATALESALKGMLHGRDAVVQLAQQILDGMLRQARTFSYLLTALASISLIGGGVGVMNVMLMNVAERRREIGIRMALGARQRDIRNLFLLEAVTLTAVGALGGAVIGVTAAYIYALMSGWQFSLAVSALPLGIGSTLLVGLFFGIYPAVSASKMQPVDALRDE